MHIANNAQKSLVNGRPLHVHGTPVIMSLWHHFIANSTTSVRRDDCCGDVSSLSSSVSSRWPHYHRSQTAGWRCARRWQLGLWHNSIFDAVGRRPCLVHRKSAEKGSGPVRSVTVSRVDWCDGGLSAPVAAWRDVSTHTSRHRPAPHAGGHWLRSRPGQPWFSAIDAMWSNCLHSDG